VVRTDLASLALLLSQFHSQQELLDGNPKQALAVASFLDFLSNGRHVFRGHVELIKDVGHFGNLTDQWQLDLKVERLNDVKRAHVIPC
jgi:hypothetical protein